MKSLAPIILFVYNRPWHTLQTLEALSKNTLAKESILYIYSDAAKEESQIDKVNEVREVIKSKQWCLQVKIIERKTNFGLSSNVIEGITEIVNQYGEIIVLEDDLVTSPYFLEYCNDGLEIYHNEKSVYSINGYQFPLGINKSDTFLCPLATSSWGWATWADRWSAFEIELKYRNVIQKNRFLTQRFNLADYDYTNMLGNEKSWAIRWYYSVFVRNGLGLFPTQSLVKNIGFDGKGENYTSDLSNDFNQNITNLKIVVIKKHTINFKYYEIILNYFTHKKRTDNPSVINLIGQDIKKYFKLIFARKNI